MSQMVQVLPELQIIQVGLWDCSNTIECSRKVAGDSGNRVRITATIQASGVASIHYTRTVGTGKRGKGQMSPIEIPKLWAGGPDSPFLVLRERQSFAP